MEVSLGLDELGLFGFLGGALFVQQRLYLRGRGAGINRLLQSLSIRVRCGTRKTTTTAAATTTAASKSAEHSAHGIASGVHHLLHHRFDSAPVGIIGKAKAIFVIIQHALLHLGGIKVPAATATTTAAATASTITTAIILC